MTGDGTVQVVVVGAGLSGLIAARSLQQRGIEVLVLEAADRIGGRTMGETSALGSRLDVGGQWIGHNHEHLKALVAELGLTSYPMDTETLPRFIEDDRRIAALSPSVLAAVAYLAGLGIATKLRKPERWSDVTLSRWLSKVPIRRTRRVLEVLSEVSWTADLDEMTMRNMAEMLRHQGGMRTALSTRGGAQDSLIVEGVGTITDRLAAELSSPVRTGWQVTSITRDEDGATVHTTSGIVRAQKVIVTVPPPMAARIDHEPALPPERIAVQNDSYMGLVYKAIVVYETPFWRKGKGPVFISLGDLGAGVFDSSPPNGPGHLCVLVGGQRAQVFDDLDAEARRDMVLTPLAAQLGADILTPASWHDKSWHLDEHAGGGYLALPKRTHSGSIFPMPSEPLGPIHWAGTETASGHPGYLDGAIEAGLRVADEVRESLETR